MRSRRELEVIMRAKDLCSYVMTVTQKSPKQFRFTFTTKLQNLSMEIITDLYLANDIFVENIDEADAIARTKQRLNLQRRAMTNTRLIAYIAQLSLENKAITGKQYEQISRYTTEIQQMSVAWIKGDKKRLGI